MVYAALATISCCLVVEDGVLIEGFIAAAAIEGGGETGYLLLEGRVFYLRG